MIFGFFKIIFKILATVLYPLKWIFLYIVSELNNLKNVIISEKLKIKIKNNINNKIKIGYKRNNEI